MARFITQGTRSGERGSQPRRRKAGHGYLSLTLLIAIAARQGLPCPLSAMRAHAACLLAFCSKPAVPIARSMTDDSIWKLICCVRGLVGLGPFILAAVLTFDRWVLVCWVVDAAPPSVGYRSPLSRSSRCCDLIPWALFCTFFSRFFWPDLELRGSARSPFVTASFCVHFQLSMRHE